MPTRYYPPRSTIALIVLVLAVSILSSCAKQDSEDSGSPYNILLITLDTTRADHLSCYGYEKKTSPNLDALAADGVRFNMAIATASITPVSHASIMTGLNPNKHGLRVFYGPTGYFLESSFPTLATILAKQGWVTGAFISAYPASERFGLHWGFHTFESGLPDSIMTEDPAKIFPIEGRFLNKRSVKAQRRADATTDQALEWLKSARRPFFTWLHYFDPHDPTLIPPMKELKEFGPKENSMVSFETLYDPEVHFMDKQIGRVIDYLKETGEYDHTVIVAIADHGQGLGQHGWLRHRLLYQEQLRLPFIARIPKGTRGVTVPQIVRSIDVMPTILEAVGLHAPSPIEGISLIGLMEGEEQAPQLAYAEALNTIDEHTPKELPESQRDDLFCMMDDTWKLIYHKHKPKESELYNIVDDPNELTNLIKEHPQEAARLAEALKKSGAMTVKRIEPGGPMDEEALEKLRSLGYAGGNK